MNGEIKFRVYDEDLKKMRYLNNSHDFICFDEKGNGYYHNMQTGLGERFSDLMQYVGLKDKNGVEIYEGDLLKSYYDKPGIVKWNDEIGAFQIKGIPSQTMKRCHEMEVIGNIYENEENGRYHISIFSLR